MAVVAGNEAALLQSRMTLRSNPRAWVPLLLPPGLIAASVGIALLTEVWPVLIVVAPVGLIGYRVIRYLLKQFRNRLRLYDDRIELDFMGEEQAVVRWTELSRAGLATKGRRRSIFLYRADEDQLVELSDEFESFEAILDAVRARTDFEELDLGGHRNVTEFLRAEAAAEQPEEGAGEATADPSAADR